MIQNSENLWPSSFEGAKEAAPKVILKQQAEYFNQMQKNVLIAEVITIPWPEFNWRDRSFNIRNSFVIKVPSIGNFKYEWFEVLHGMPSYPALVVLGTDSMSLDEGRLVHNEKELKDHLGQIFKSNQTREIIASLRALA